MPLGVGYCRSARVGPEFSTDLKEMIMKSKRCKVLRLVNDTFDVPQLMAILKKLPEDARVLKAADLENGSFGLLIHSETFDEAVEGMKFPDIEVFMTETDLQDATKFHQENRVDGFTPGVMHSGLPRRMTGKNPNIMQLPKDLSRLLEKGERISPQVDYGEMEVRIMATCTCDMAYTGLRKHKAGCPLLRKS